MPFIFHCTFEIVTLINIIMPLLSFYHYGIVLSDLRFQRQNELCKILNPEKKLKSNEIKYQEKNAP